MAAAPPFLENSNITLLLSPTFLLLQHPLLIIRMNSGLLSLATHPICEFHNF